jgi:hypothetical protein
MVFSLWERKKYTVKFYGEERRLTTKVVHKVSPIRLRLIGKHLKFGIFAPPQRQKFMD